MQFLKSSFAIESQLKHFIEVFFLHLKDTPKAFFFKDLEQFEVFFSIEKV